jgi:DNA-binding transcriptional MerR regulator
MENNPKRFAFDELCTLVEMPGRTVRYYIQQGLVDRPEGAKRGSFYLHKHLHQLLTIRKWQQAGLSLGRIREILQETDDGGNVPPRSRAMPGDISVRSHITLASGIEIVVDPTEAGLSPEQMRRIVRETTALMKQITEEN